MRSMIRWVLTIIIFAMLVVGLEVYRNTEIMDKGYLLQELKIKKKNLKEENDYLHQKLSPYLSLNRVEEYARKHLGLDNPKKLRFLQERLSPPMNSSSPPPISLQKNKKERHFLLFEMLGNLMEKLNLIFHAKK